MLNKWIDKRIEKQLDKSVEDLPINLSTSIKYNTCQNIFDALSEKSNNWSATENPFDFMLFKSAIKGIIDKVEKVAEYIFKAQYDSAIEKKVDDYLKSEKFVDKLVDRINRKQLRQ